MSARRDPKQAVERFLKDWSGALSHLTNEDIERTRLGHLREKHLKDDPLARMIALAEKANPGPLSEATDDAVREALADGMAIRHR